MTTSTAADVEYFSGILKVFNTLGAIDWEDIHMLNESILQSALDEGYVEIVYLAESKEFQITDKGKQLIEVQDDN